MALSRSKYGIEFDSDSSSDGPALPRLLLVTGLVAAISLGYSLYRRSTPGSAQGSACAQPRMRERVEAPPAPRVEAPPPPPPVESIRPRVRGVKRPPRLQNLLLRLEAAETARDAEMAVSTIEQIRALPGNPAADLDAVLAKRLGDLNLRRLFVLKNAQWVREVTVKSGSNASRIAREHGSTLAAMERLNGGSGSVRRLRVGQRVKVMDHPRFRLSLRRGSRQADLALNGKFFRRYQLANPVSAPVGEFEFPGRARDFWGGRGIAFAAVDRAELETLVPIGSPVVVEAEEGLPPERPSQGLHTQQRQT